MHYRRAMEAVKLNKSCTHVANWAVLLVVISLFWHNAVAMNGSELQQVFSEAVSQNATSFSDMAQRLGDVVRTKQEEDGKTEINSPGAVYDATCWASSATLAGCLQEQRKVRVWFVVWILVLDF